MRGHKLVGEADLYAACSMKTAAILVVLSMVLVLSAFVGIFPSVPQPMLQESRPETWLGALPLSLVLWVLGYWEQRRSARRRSSNNVLRSSGGQVSHSYMIS